MGNYNFNIKPFFRFSFKCYLKNFSSAVDNLYKILNMGYLPKINLIL